MDALTSLCPLDAFVNHVYVLRVLTLFPLIHALIRRVETDLVRSFCVGLSYDVN